MHKLKNTLLCTLGTFFIINTYAQENYPNANALMTARDLKNNALSNVTITNHAGQPVPAAGLFISSFDINDCAMCYGGLVSGDNVGGAIVSPLTFNTNQALAIGQNYLYNMVYNGIYYIKQTAGSAPCSLPGCSWPGDDLNVHGWCVTINIISAKSNYTYSHYTNGSLPAANSPPYAEASNSNPYDYKYDLINPATQGTGGACIGPIACNDKTLTCKVASAQNESFQPY